MEMPRSCDRPTSPFTRRSFSIACLAVAACLLAGTTAELQAEQWSQFRGPKFDGVAGSSFPESWSPEENVRWKFALEGEGWSCPIVWDNQVFLTAAVPQSAPPAAPAQPQGGRGRRGGYGGGFDKITYKWETLCLDADSGDVLWRQTARVGKPRMGRHRDNSYATETPVTDGKRVYAYFGMMGLYCYDMQGNLQWEKDLGSYQMRADWGTATSPVLHDNKLLLQIDNEDQSFLVAIDAESGEQVWRTERDEMSQYSTPIIWQNSLRTELVTCGRYCRSYDPATGKLLWEVSMEGGRSSCSPLAVGDHLFVGTEFRNRGGPDDGGGVLFALKPTESGAEVEWKTDRSGIQMASPVLCEGHLYFFERRSGTLHCFNAETGERAYRQRVPGARAFWASPWTKDDKVFCTDDNGTTHVVAGGPTFQVIDTNEIPERTWSSPAIADGALFFRTSDHLYCFAAAE